MLEGIYTLGDLSIGYGLFVSLQASAIETEWHGVIVLLGLAAVGMTILGLLLNYLIARNIKPARELQDEKYKEAPEVERYRKPTRVLHWVCAAAFVILFTTGIIRFISSQSELAPGGWLNVLHIVAGVVFIAVPVIYFLMNRKASLMGIRRAFTWGKEDLDWMKAAPQYYYLCDERAMPPQGYLNTLQKIWLLLVIVFGLMLAVSGLIMWAFKTIAPAELLQFMIFLHDIAFITTGTMFLVHIYISVLHPMSGPMKTGAWSAITRGKVSAEYARSNHGKWYQEASGAQKTGDR